jgi:ABC-type bacteriocin/lantibiotic exporter with double-glycine peptidase domain
MDPRNNAFGSAIGTARTRGERAPHALGRSLAVGLLLLAGAACRSSGYAPQLSESAVTLDLPLVRQDDLYACGLASISALCQYWGVPIPAEESAALAALAAEKEGLSGGELCAALERFGMETFLFQGEIDRSPTGLLHHVEAGRPLLVMLSPDGEANHYCLVLGFDEPRANLILLDPRKGEILVPFERFRRDWERCRRFTLLACKKETLSTEVPDSIRSPS